MRKQISKFSIYQTAKITAILVFIISALVCVPWSLYMLVFFSCGECLFLLIFPFLYALMSFIGYAFLIWIYNFAAGRFGGIEFNLKDVE